MVGANNPLQVRENPLKPPPRPANDDFPFGRRPKTHFAVFPYKKWKFNKLETQKLEEQ